MSHRARSQRNYYPKKLREESDEITLLRARFSQNLALLNEIFPDWSDEDLLYTLQDTQGDFELAVARISEGFATQWGEVKGRKVKKEIIPEPVESTLKQTRHQEIKKPKNPLYQKTYKTPKEYINEPDRRTGKSTYRINEEGSIIPSSENSSDSLHKDRKNPNITSNKVVNPPPANTWASRIAKAASKVDSAAKSKTSGIRPTKIAGSAMNGVNNNNLLSTTTDKLPDPHSLNILNDDSSWPTADGNLIDNNIIPKKDINPVLPVNSWAKIASRTKQSTSTQKSKEDTTSSIQTTTNNIETTKQEGPIKESKPQNNKEPTSNEEKKVVFNHNSYQPPNGVEDLTGEIKDALNHKEVELIKPNTNESEISLDEVMASMLEEKVTIENNNKNVSSSKTDQGNLNESNSQTSELVIPQEDSTKLGSSSNKFVKIDTSDDEDDDEDVAPISEPKNNLSIDNTHLDQTQATGRHPPPGINSTPNNKPLPPGIPVGPPGLAANVRSNQRPVAPVRQTSYTGNSYPANTVEKQTSNDAQVEEQTETSIESTPIQSEQQANKEQNNNGQNYNQNTVVPQDNVPNSQTSPAVVDTTPQTNAQDMAGHPPPFMHYPGYMPQPPMHGMQPHMLNQGMPQHLQAQNSYMAYYGQYNYGPGHYNPYHHGNNYTLQFAQKSLGSYDENNSNGFSQMNQNNTNSNQDTNNYNQNYQGPQNNTYEKNKGKGFEQSTSEQQTIPPQHNGPMGYGNFPYGGMPYQPQGMPNDGSVYYHHPYYPQQNQQQMFGYMQHNQQHLPPHMQHQMPGYPGPNAQTQGQQHYQQQPQQGSTNVRYPNWSS